MIKGDKPIVIFDYESNDFVAHKNFQIIQYAFKVITVDGGIQTFTGFVKPNGHMSRSAEKIHGFSNEFLEEHGQPLSEVKDLIAHIMLDTEHLVTIGHNAIKFDIPATDKLLGTEISTTSVFDTAGEFKAKKLGTIRESSELIYDYHKKALNTPRKGLFFNLALCLEDFGIEPTNIGKAHDALVDITNTEQVFLKQVIDYTKLNNLIKDYYADKKSS